MDAITLFAPVSLGAVSTEQAPVDQERLFQAYDERGDFVTKSLDSSKLCLRSLRILPT
ncbi:uncharacterized protein UTRI_02896 [Ustilago trichophora]|uniref:Uncharacterized protein n=1 Tax=Ustilago trichophora TaxID=86804 RepID=A0A5C3ESJ6_9BASI|nr:uncharacterized protein UTRI_02896 [Ustilago trichophora]